MWPAQCNGSSNAGGLRATGWDSWSPGPEPACSPLSSTLRGRRLPSPGRCAATAPWSASLSSGSAARRWTASYPQGSGRKHLEHCGWCWQSHRSRQGSGGWADGECTAERQRKVILQAAWWTIQRFWVSNIDKKLELISVWEINITGVLLSWTVMLARSIIHE